MSGENFEQKDVSYAEFCNSLVGYFSPGLDVEDSRDIFVKGYAELSIEAILELSLSHDLAAIFSAGMAVTAPRDMNGFAEIVVDRETGDSIRFYVRRGHEAEAFLLKLREARSWRVIRQIHRLLTLASQDKDVRDRILDGQIMALTNPKKKTARRA